MAKIAGGYETKNTVNRPGVHSKTKTFQKQKFQKL